MESIVIHYQEIALKGRNRPWFIGRLVRNLKAAMADLDVRGVRALMGRIEVSLGPGTSWAAASDRIGRVFGIANFSRAGTVRLETGSLPGVTADMDRIARAILQDLEDVNPTSFRVAARRADKRFPLISPEIEREVGGRIREARGWKVDLDHPDLTVHLELLTDRAFYFFGKKKGVGGLPSGTSGRVACLLSGGIDSPVAAFRMMKRGCSVQLVHFHSYPILSRASIDKARQLAQILTRYQLASRLHLVPFGELQQQVVLAVPPPLRVVIYRRLMVRIAEQLARASRSRALVTGEVVGQVASQTVENVSVIDAAATMPILRPLIGMDKEEIMAEAQRLGTYATSILPDQDCCQLFTPRHPSTKARSGEVLAAEQRLDVGAMVAHAVERTEAEEFSFPAVKTLQ